MTTYVEVAGALVRAGYLTDADIEAAAAVLENYLIVDAAEDAKAADVEAAAAVLADALVVAEAEDAIEAALDDEAYQEGVIIKAEKWSDEDAAAGDFKGADIDNEVIAIAEDHELTDETIIGDENIIVAEATIAAIYTDAAAALLAAELIDEANLDAVAAAIDDAWVVE